MEANVDDLETYNGKENIFEFEHIFYGQKKCNSRVVLPAGQTSFPFVFSVPDDIPSSYTGKTVGDIRYGMEGTSHLITANLILQPPIIAGGMVQNGEILHHEAY